LGQLDEASNELAAIQAHGCLTLKNLQSADRAPADGGQPARPAAAPTAQSELRWVCNLYGDMTVRRIGDL